jgi:hypothetical protein
MTTGHLGTHSLYSPSRAIVCPTLKLKRLTTNKNTYKTVTSTGATPGPVSPMVSAAAWERSTSRPSM